MSRNEEAGKIKGVPIKVRARVEAIEPCPELDTIGEGESLITAVFHHSPTKVYDLLVEGEPESIGVTGTHPIWSVDRGDWIEVRHLHVGERLLSETWTPKVLAVTLRELPEPVYNIEVDGDHCYRVGEQGLLVHNASAVGPTPITLTSAQMMQVQSIAQFRMELGLPLAGSANDDVSTIAKLGIAGQQPIWGINSGTAGLSQAKLDEYNNLAKCCNPTGTGAYSATSYHAEADTIFQAFDKKIMSNTAVIYCDRPLCNFCKTSLANLLCLVGIKTLTWIGPNASRTAYVTFTFSG